MTIKYALLVIYLLSINILQRKAKNFKQEKLIDIFRYILLYVIMIVCFSVNILMRQSRLSSLD